jgi:hypothetical protein
MSLTTATVTTIPNCDLCKHFKGTTTPAAYDGATRAGAWAYMCEEDFQTYGVGLGTGRGQKLILAND